MFLKFFFAEVAQMLNKLGDFLRAVLQDLKNVLITYEPMWCLLEMVRPISWQYENDLNLNLKCLPIIKNWENEMIRDMI